MHFEEIPRAYVDAGSRVVLTNTFRGNRLALDAAGLSDQVVEVNRAGAAISKRATVDRAAVFGSIGPSGKMLCMDEIAADELYTVFLEQASALAEGRADVIGANCGQGIEGYIGIARRLAQATERPIWIKANAGIPKVVGADVVYDTTPEQFASRAAELITAGATFIGGCCGTNPDFIRALCKELT